MRNLASQTFSETFSLRLSQAVLDSLPHQVIVLDEKGVVAACNQSCRRWACEENSLLPQPQEGVDLLESYRLAARQSPEMERALGGLMQIIEANTGFAEWEESCVDGVVHVIRAAPMVLDGRRYILLSRTDITFPRQMLLARVEAQTLQSQSESQEREMRTLEKLSVPIGTRVTARSFGAAPLSSSLPEHFLGFVQFYGDALDQAVEQRLFRVEAAPSEPMRTLAARLGFVGARPRDVIEIHTQALKRRLDQVPGPKRELYAEEGRLLVLELMGNLTAYYRNFAAVSSAEG